MKKVCLKKINVDDKNDCLHFGCKASRFLRLVIVVALTASTAWAYAATPPAEFPQGRKIEIENGRTLREISSELKSDNIVRSASLFELFVRAFGNDKNIQSGVYFFENPLSTFEIAERLMNSVFGLDPSRITIPEGATVIEIASILDRRLDGFDKKRFIELALPDEGFLFPDTYFFLSNTPPEQIIAEMKANFVKKLQPYEQELAESAYTLDELVTFASILEKEARKSSDRKMIAGILENRLKIDMPLQVDAAFRYIIGKGTFDLTLKDLKKDSPYNTYTNKGLPPGPIANPGLDSIAAVLEPKKSPYLFFLHDMAGKLHYSATFAEHKVNKYRYLP
jgi:UPF0755 protein